MNQHKIYKQIISLSNSKKNYSRKELEQKLLQIANICKSELQKVSVKNADSYKSNENSKLLRTRNNSRRAIKKFWTRREDKVTRVRIYKHIETLKKVNQTIGSMR